MPITAIPFAFPGVPGARAVFTTAQGGHGQGVYAQGNLSFTVGDDPETVRKNRRSLRDDLGFETWSSQHQVHGVDMTFDPEPRDTLEDSDEKADGLATARPGQALVVKTADCQPVLLAHASGKYVAALHVGWRGNVQGFPTIGVRRFCEHYGLEPRDVLAVRGPSLGPSAAEFVHFDREFGPAFAAHYRPVARTVDLWELTRDQLIQAGLAPENIFGLDLCTHSLKLFFSYRRKKVSGRQAGIIWIEG